jgi:EmrB/QacA subfamily drug resistance transporter
MATTTDGPGGSVRGRTAAPRGPAADGSFSDRQIKTIIGGLMLGMFLAALDQTVVSTAIRTIADDLQGYSLQAWATTAFLITSTISTPLYGKLSDLFGRKPLYLLAIALFVLGSVLCTFATSMYGLAVYRAVQGLGAGGLLSLAFTILGDLVPPRQRSKYQAYFMAVFGSSSVIGPVVGGVLSGVDSIAGLDGWRWIFLVNVPLGAAAFVVVSKVLHIPHTRRDSRVDWPGAIALSAFLVPLLVIAEQGRLWGWTSGRALVCYAVGAVGFAAFVAIETRYRDAALLPLRMFTSRTFTVGVLASAVVGLGMFGGLLLLPQYLQVVKGSSPTVAGFQMLPLVLGIMIAAATSGTLIGRTGRYKVFPVVGTALMAVVLLAMSRITADTSYWALAPLMVGLGLGLGLNMQPVILAVQNASDPRDMGVATSSVTFFRQIGGTVGTAVFLSILFSVLGGRVTSAYTAAAASDPAFQAALAADPAQAQALSAGTSGALESTQFLGALDPAVAHPFLEAFADSLGTIFLIAAAAMVVGFVITLFLPELPLKTTSGVQEQAHADRAAMVSAGSAAPTSSAPSAAPTEPAGPRRG